MLAGIGGVMAWQTRGLAAESIWYVLPGFAVLVFSGVLQVWLQRPTVRARRRGLLFGVATVALLASGLLASLVFSLVRGGASSFDTVGLCSAVVTGLLAAWLWLRVVRILRQT